jgi:pimeloyl-ACP methyl ester carboxylesterase
MEPRPSSHLPVAIVRDRSADTGGKPCRAGRAQSGVSREGRSYLFEVFVRAFEKTGFRGGLNWYRNVDRNWEESANLVERVDQPSLMITAELDPVLWPEQTKGMERWVPNLKHVNIKGSGHWAQQENPAEVNAAILEFLADLRK